MKFEGRTFFITGGVSGLGEGVARLFVSKGANVVLADINKSKGTKVVASLGDTKALFTKCDVTKEKSVQEAIDAGLAKFGAIHGCVNCAGIGYPRRVLSKSGKVHPLPPFSKVIEINLIGTFNVLRLCAKAMIANEPDVDTLERGVIINTASVAAFDGQIGQAAYSASKSGVCGMTLPIARDLGGFGIRICTIAPGIFETPMTKIMPKAAAQNLINMKQFPKRMGHTSEFAALAGHIVENSFPVATLCALHVMKCGTSTESRLECDNLVYWTNRICAFAFLRYTFQGVISKLHMSRVFAMRRLTIANYQKFDQKHSSQYIAAAADSELTENKEDEKLKLEKRLRNLLSLRTFTYDVTEITPWLCVYLSVHCAKSSVFYIKTFGSTLFYQNLSRTKHEKNKYLLKIAASGLLLTGLALAIGNETYFEGVKFVRKWFLDPDEYAVESQNGKTFDTVDVPYTVDEVKECMTIINESGKETPGGGTADIIHSKKHRRDSLQIEGKMVGTQVTGKEDTLREKLDRGDYQRESEMLLSRGYFGQKAHDLFEYVTDIFVGLEDTYLNSTMLSSAEY